MHIHYNGITYQGDLDPLLNYGLINRTKHEVVLRITDDICMSVSADRIVTVGYHNVWLFKGYCDINDIADCIIAYLSVKKYFENCSNIDITKWYPVDELINIT